MRWWTGEVRPLTRLSTYGKLRSSFGVSGDRIKGEKAIRFIEANNDVRIKIGLPRRNERSCYDSQTKAEKISILEVQWPTLEVFQST